MKKYSDAKNRVGVGLAALAQGNPDFARQLRDLAALLGITMYFEIACQFLGIELVATREGQRVGDCLVADLVAALTSYAPTYPTPAWRRAIEDKVTEAA